MKLSGAVRRMTIATSVLSAAFVVAYIGYATYAGWSLTSAAPFAGGVILAAAVGVLRIVLLERSLVRAVEMGDRAGMYMQKQYLMRFAMLAAAFAAAALVPWLSIWGAAAGITAAQIAVPMSRTKDTDAVPSTVSGADDDDNGLNRHTDNDGSD